MSDGKETGNFGALTIKFEREENTTVLSLYGEADLFSAASLEEQLQRALAADSDRVIVDLGGLDFIDSICLRALLKAALASRQDSGRLYFRQGGPQVERILTVSGIKQQLQFLD